MDLLERFTEYASAFGDVFKSDDWTVLEPFFTEGAVYALEGADFFAGRHEGREAIFAALKASLDSFDRRFATRSLEIQDGPALREGAVWFKWQACYRSPGVPELVIGGTETITFDGDRIERLVDHFPLQMGGIVENWFSHYGSLLPDASV